VKNPLANFRKDWNKFPEISKLTTVVHSHPKGKERKLKSPMPWLYGL